MAQVYPSTIQTQLSHNSKRPEQFIPRPDTINGVTNAKQLPYDSDTSLLNAENVQDAIDELNVKVFEDLASNQVSFDNTETGMAADNVQSAIAELFTDVDDGKELIADAIFDRGIIASKDDTFEQLASKILMLLGNVIRQVVDTVELLSEEPPTVTETVTISFYTPLEIDVTESITELETEVTVVESSTVLVEEEI